METASGTAESPDPVPALAQEIFTGVAGKWALLILETLADRTLRFSELKRQVPGISHKMLAQTLRALERDAVVHRTVHPTVPPSVEYRLTEAGRELRGTVFGLCAWTRRHYAEIEAARRRSG
ncbi:helix-turn-helix domain-containing protein [Streptomyces xiamenensis]|uniref:winged helix-turn-helix transcriptional regulator n=1 Tax=Streptomyces xiamenensis TaxID=408015 RepID=UPI003441B4FF